MRFLMKVYLGIFLLILNGFFVYYMMENGTSYQTCDNLFNTNKNKEEVLNKMSLMNLEEIRVQCKEVVNLDKDNIFLKRECVSLPKRHKSYEIVRIYENQYEIFDVGNKPRKPENYELISKREVNEGIPVHCPIPYPNKG